LKKIRLVYAFSALLAGAVFSMPVAAELKIGVVNLAQVLAQSPQAEAAKKKLEKEFSGKDNSLVAAQKKIRQQEERLTKDGAVMSESERKKLERNIVNERRELTRKQDEFREDLTIRRNEELGKIQKNIVDTVRALAKEENYDLILGEGILYTSDQVNLTGKVIKRMTK